MLGLLTKTTCPIGVDLGYDSLRIAQLSTHGGELSLVSCRHMPVPAFDPPGCPQWQRWAIDAIRHSFAKSGFRGRDVVVALPAAEIVVDHLKPPKSSGAKGEDAVFAKIKPKLPSAWSRANTVIKCIPTEQETMLVIAADRPTIDRHLAIYERAHLKVKSMVVWPTAMACCHARLFARRDADLNAVVMLLDIQSEYSNVVVCRGANLLLAGSIPIGVHQLSDTTEVGRLAWELTARREQLVKLYRDVEIERLVILSGPSVAPEVFRAIGTELGVRTQLGDCQAALGMETAIDGQEAQTNWALAFGLGLS